MSESAWERRLGSIIQGRYRLESFLARGGMGAVFLCEDLRLVGKRWALKEMLVSDPADFAIIEESFRRETEILSLLHHESLPVMVDSFVEEFRRYLVMEYMEGENLAQKVGIEGPTGEAQAVFWGGQLCQVVSYLHSQDPPVLFHDLKPENIIVTSGGALRLVDFGLARRMGDRTTKVSGTVGYASPEQWEESGHTDKRSDVYGLGATLYFLLTGHPPVYGSQRIRQYRPQLEAGLEAIIHKCLENDPALRYPDCQALAHDLLQWSARPQTPSVPPKPSRLGTLIGSALVACLAGSLLWVGLKSPMAPGPLAPAGIEQVLSRTADSKMKARQALEVGNPTQAMTILDELVTQYPEDGDAQILKNNAQALQTGGPLIRIPVLGSISGTEYEGIQMLQGLALAQRELNRLGIVDGAQPRKGRHSIVLEFLDCQSRQNLTLEFSLRLAADPACQVVIGPWTSQQALAIAPILDKAGIPTISPVASDPRVWKLGSNTFTSADSDRGRLKAVARHFVGVGRRRAAVVRNDDNVVSQSAAQEFKEILTELGGEAVAELSYVETTKDYSGLLTEVKRVKADFMFVSEYRTDALVEISRQIAAQGLHIPLGTQAAYSTALVQNRELKGLVTSTYFYPDASLPAIQDFTRRFQALCGNVQPCHRQSNSYDTLRVVAQAIETSGFRRGAVRDYLASLGDTRPLYNGITGEFAPSRRLDRRKAYLVEIQNGKFALLK